MAPKSADLAQIDMHPPIAFHMINSHCCIRSNLRYSLAMSRQDQPGHVTLMKKPPCLQLHGACRAMLCCAHATTFVTLNMWQTHLDAHGSKAIRKGAEIKLRTNMQAKTCRFLTLLHMLGHIRAGKQAHIASYPSRIWSQLCLLSY